jgi:alpha-galactosidase
LFIFIFLLFLSLSLSLSLSFFGLLSDNDIFKVTLTIHWTDIGYPPNSTLFVRDLWKHKELGQFTNSFTATVEGHSVVMIVVRP